MEFKVHIFSFLYISVRSMKHNLCSEKYGAWSF